MSEKSKAEKLADAKRRLKEYKKTSKILPKDEEICLEGDNTVKNQEVAFTAQSSGDGNQQNTPEDIRRPPPPESYQQQPHVLGQYFSSSHNGLLELTGNNQPPNAVESFAEVPSTISSAPPSATLANNDEFARAMELLIGEKQKLILMLEEQQAVNRISQTEIQTLKGRHNTDVYKIKELQDNVANLSAERAQLSTETNSLRSAHEKNSAEIDSLRGRLQECTDFVSEMKAELAKEKQKNLDLEAMNETVERQLKMQAAFSEANNQSVAPPNCAHEQQINDLQAMVRQLETEKHQENLQLQGYIQQMSKEIESRTKQNLELTNQLTATEEREQSLILHIGQLEKEIQQTFTQKQQNAQQQEAANRTSAATDVEISNQSKEEVLLLKEQISTKDLRLIALENSYKQLQIKLDLVNEKSVEHEKFLADIESHKIGASRAVAQNNELKQLLDDLNHKLIQITDDKVELVNALHSEQHQAKEIRSINEQLSVQLSELQEKWMYKEEEMIRLSHENNELLSQLEKQSKNEEIAHVHDIEHVHEINEDHHHVHEHEHGDTCNEAHSTENGDYDKPVVIEPPGMKLSPQHQKENNDDDHMHIASTEAMLKLQERFKRVMNEMANLTDEKQQLEHLVLQLQGETETIGEYIYLYQIQRRMLKHRELEKEAQIQRLTLERNDVYSKLTHLTHLLNHISDGSGSDHVDLKSIAVSENETPNVTENANVKLSNGQKIPFDIQNPVIGQITSLVSELKEHYAIGHLSPSSVDHCVCCSGNLETI